MRIGLSVTDERLAAVVIHGGQILCTAEATTPNSFAERLVRLFEQLARSISGVPVDPNTSITIDVSGALVPDTQTPITVVRIAPRKPVDSGHEMTPSPQLTLPIEVVHVAGGHSILGTPLVSLQIDELSPVFKHPNPGLRYVISGVGSLMNSGHEQAVGRLILERADPASIDYAHQFSSGAIAIRERTALLNSSLLENAASLSTTLGLVAAEWFPRARLFVTTNDGGSAPVGRLADSPVHSVYSGRATELIGAAAICGVEEGGLIVSDGTDAFYGELVTGAPTVVPEYRDTAGQRIATQAANILTATPSLIARQQDSVTLVTHGENGTLNLGVERSRHSEVELRALGAACVPRSAWANRVVDVNNATEMQQALAAARARVEARLVSFGSNPSDVRILESSVIATAYQHPRVVSVRVRGVEDESTATTLSGGKHDAADS